MLSHSSIYFSPSGSQMLQQNKILLFQFSFRYVSLTCCRLLEMLQSTFFACKHPNYLKMMHWAKWMPQKFRPSLDHLSNPLQFQKIAQSSRLELTAKRGCLHMVCKYVSLKYRAKFCFQMFCCCHLSAGRTFKTWITVGEDLFFHGWG